MIDKIKEHQMEIQIGVVILLLLGVILGSGGRKYEYQSVNLHEPINLVNMETQIYGIEKVEGANEVKVIFHFTTDPIQGENTSTFPYIKIYDSNDPDNILYSSFLKSGDEDVEVLFLTEEWEKLEKINIDYYTISTEEELEYSVRKSYSVVYKDDIYESVNLKNMLTENIEDVDDETKGQRLDYIQKRYFTTDKLYSLDRKEQKEIKKIFKEKPNKAYEDLVIYLQGKKEEISQFYKMLLSKEVTEEEIGIAFIPNNFTKTKENFNTLNETGDERVREDIALLENKLLYDGYTEEQINVLIKDQDNVKSLQVLKDTYVDYLEKESDKSDKADDETQDEYIARLEKELKLEYPDFEKEELENNLQNLTQDDTQTEETANQESTDTTDKSTSKDSDKEVNKDEK